MKRSAFATILGSLAVGTCLATVAGAQEKVLRIGMTAADIPRTLGQPDQGFEGNRFTGLTDVRRADDVGPLVGRQGQRDDPRARDRMEGRRCRQEEMDVQAAARRQIPRRLAVQCRCRGLERREGAEARRRRISMPARSASPPRACRRWPRPQDRRHDGGADHQGAGQFSADQPDQSVHGQPAH